MSVSIPILSDKSQNKSKIFWLTGIELNFEFEAPVRCPRSVMQPNLSGAIDLEISETILWSYSWKLYKERREEGRRQNESEEKQMGRETLKKINK